MRFDRPEIWTLAAVFAIASLVLAFGHIAEEMLEGDATKFDERILLFLRSANDVSDPVGPPWMERWHEILRPWVVSPYSALLSSRWSFISSWRISVQPRSGS